MSQLRMSIWKNRYVYLLVLPTLAYFVIFKYVPIYGVSLAFKKFSYLKGITHSPWVGLENFREILVLPDFWRSVRNTVVLAGMRLVIFFPAPILLAILINEMRFKKFKAFTQTVYTFPHFLSWVVISGVMLDLLGGDGAVNAILQSLGFEGKNILVSNEHFRFFLVGSEVWKEAGWSTIIYLAALSGIDPTQYEAADIDGANRLQKIQIIVWPALIPAVSILLILFLGNVMNSTAGAGTETGFMQVLNLYNPAVYESADIIDTFVYRRTFFMGASFGTSTAIGLFKSVINCVLLFCANKFARHLGGNALI